MPPQTLEALLRSAGNGLDITYQSAIRAILGDGRTGNEYKRESLRNMLFGLVDDDEIEELIQELLFVEGCNDEGEGEGVGEDALVYGGVGGGEWVNGGGHEYEYDYEGGGAGGGASGELEYEYGFVDADGQWMAMEGSGGLQGYGDFDEVEGGNDDELDAEDHARIKSYFGGLDTSDSPDATLTVPGAKSDGALLQSLFPSLDPARLTSVLSGRAGDVRRAVGALLATGAVHGSNHGSNQGATGSPPVSTPPLQQTPDAPRSTQICRHFLSGYCARADCWFSHSLDATVCKFWLKGWCAKGAQCEFSHGWPAPLLPTPPLPLPLPVVPTPAAPLPATPAKRIPSMDDFPSLSSSTAAAASKNGSRSVSPSPQTTLADLVSLFPHIDKDAVRVCFETCDNVLTASQNCLYETYPRAPLLKHDSVSFPWITSGSLFSPVYQSLFTQAQDISSQRDAFIKTTISSHGAGDTPAATDAANHALDTNAEVARLLKDANQLLFHSAPVYDLDNLHPIEARAYLLKNLTTLLTPPASTSPSPPIIPTSSPTPTTTTTTSPPLSLLLDTPSPVVLTATHNQPAILLALQDLVAFVSFEYGLSSDGDHIYVIKRKSQ